MAKTIQIHYHPATKEVKFMTEDGKPFIVKKDGKTEDLPEQLEKWQHGNFVLQEHGTDFFDSISEALDGNKEIDLQFYGTIVDYEDFEEMVKHYNEHGDKCKFTCRQSGVLLSMDEMYEETKKFGDNVVQQLKLKLDELAIAGGSNETKDKFKNQLRCYIKWTEAKIDSLQSTSINICFVGTYSAGKSSLINAILGEKILPKDPKSKTAKFCIINQPNNGDNESIEFDLDGVLTTIVWNGKSLELLGMGGHKFRTSIQTCIDENKNELKHKQFYQMLDLLNTVEKDKDNKEIPNGVGVKININYTIPINNEAMSFTIYDTPGTGSNTSKHKEVLKEAIQEQSNSIVIFVCTPTKLEGEGNTLLLEILNNKKQNNIDLDRSLYVINHSDGSSPDELARVHEETIELKESTEVKKDKNSTEVENDENKKNAVNRVKIPLKDKKLFFIYATGASAAKAKKTGVGDKDDVFHWKRIPDEPLYDFNRYGNSEFATERTRKIAEERAEVVDEYEKAYIDTGLFSLVEAIKEYGKKYAMATKVNVLVSSVQNILNELKKESKLNKDLCDIEVEKLQKDLDTIKGRITKSIESEYQKYTPKKNNEIWVLEKEEDLKRLGVDHDSIEKVKSSIIKIVENLLISFGKKKTLKSEIKYNKIDNEKIIKTFNSEIKKLIDNFNKNQKNAVEIKYKAFKEAVINVIKEDGDLTQAAKDFLIQGFNKENFNINDVADYKKDINEMIKNLKDKKGWWIFKKEVVNTSKLLKTIKAFIGSILIVQAQELTNQYAKNLENVITDVKKTFDDNAEEYSVKIGEIKENKEQVLEIAEKIDKTSQKLEELLNNLKALIWKGKNNE